MVMSAPILRDDKKPTTCVIAHRLVLCEADSCLYRVPLYEAITTSPPEMSQCGSSGLEEHVPIRRELNSMVTSILS